MSDKNNFEKNKPTLGWRFDNSYLDLPGMLYTQVLPTKARSPELVLFNKNLAESLGLRSDIINGEIEAEIFSGNHVPEGAQPIAQAYAGHQFGYFTFLGDGRAILLGEHVTPNGQRFDIQLKGSGITPYSRRGDGRAALGPMVREYIISEAMHSLGIPTTRSLAVSTTGESVSREKRLSGAVLTRVAASHIRVGTFEYVSQKGSVEDLKRLADYTINRHYPGSKSFINPYRQLLKATVRRQAQLIAKWQLVGFVHGVMNTDNMTISGETIDYGPCAFIDTYSSNAVFSSIDNNGRYAYGNQPKIAVWNLARFAETLLILLHKEPPKAIEIAETELAEFSSLYQTCWTNGMRSKLGIFNEEEKDKELFDHLLQIMQKNNADYTNTFLELTQMRKPQGEMEQNKEFVDWYIIWRDRLTRQSQSKSQSIQLMKDSNPAVIPRNHRVEEALKAIEEKNDYSILNALFNILEKPYAHTIDQLPYTKPPSPSDKPYVTFCGT
ncbi:MAG: YdiU family protein [Eubacteriales bacterium]|nr:YdiU family protein [Eubacteriales bacterium]